MRNKTYPLLWQPLIILIILIIVDYINVSSLKTLLYWRELMWRNCETRLETLRENVRLSIKGKLTFTTSQTPGSATPTPISWSSTFCQSISNSTLIHFSGSISGSNDWTWNYYYYYYYHLISFSSTFCQSQFNILIFPVNIIWPLFVLCLDWLAFHMSFKSNIRE